MAAEILFEADAGDVDVRVSGGIGVLLITTDEGRAIVSVSPETLERLVVRIRMELDSAAPRTGRR